MAAVEIGESVSRQGEATPQLLTHAHMHNACMHMHTHGNTASI